MNILIFKGILTGLLLSLPLGPVGMYCSELTIVEGRWKGYITALGMVTIDVLYSFLSLSFLYKIEDFISKYELYLSIAIGSCLALLAIRKLVSKIELKEVNCEFKSMIQNYFIGIGFALANISSVLLITFIFTLLNVHDYPKNLSICYIPLGVLVGGSSIWLTTTRILTHYKENIKKDKVIKVIKLVNLIILIFSLVLITSSLIKIMKY